MNVKLKPILFNTDMVKAILGGRKTVTRRLIKPQPGADAKMAYTYAAGRKQDWGKWRDLQTGQQWNPPHHADDILYVRETWQYGCHADGNGNIDYETGQYFYAADDPNPFDFWIMPDGTERDSMPWRPSIHMPKEAARIFLKVKSVRVERLQDITADECPMEGTPLFSGLVGEREALYRNSFAKLWDSTIKPADLDTYGWDANPWVWVIKFERCENTEEDG